MGPKRAAACDAHGESARGRRLGLTAVLVIAAALRLVNLWGVSRLPIAEYQFQWSESDMNIYATWAASISAGDLLGRETPHPFTGWMQAIAPQETWERWWGGRHVFHNAPLYPYVLAAAQSTLGTGFWGMALVQLLIALLGVTLVFLITAQTFGATAATFSALIAAVYGPAMLYESLALRDSLGTTTSLALLWGLLRSAHGGRARWFVAGLLLATAVLAREATAGFAPFVVAWAGWLYWGRWRSLATTLGWLIAGFALGVMPLVARNLAVGAPPLALSSIGTLGIVYGHVVDTTPALVELTSSTTRVLRESDGELRRALPLIWATYDGDWGRFIGNQAVRLAAVVSSFEAWDNANWYYYRPRLPVLRWSLRFEIVLALGLLGLVLARRSLDRHAPLWLFLVASVVSLLATCVIGRYRLPLVAVLSVYAGVTLAWMLERIRARGWRDLAVASVSAVAVVAGSRSILAPFELRKRERAAEYALAAGAHAARGETDAAIAEARDGLGRAYRGTDQLVLPPVYALLAQMFTVESSRRGQGPEAVAELTTLARHYPNDADLEVLLGMLHRDALHDPRTAAAHFAAAERLRSLAASAPR